jgi:hypothetical protein
MKFKFIKKFILRTKKIFLFVILLNVLILITSFYNYTSRRDNFKIYYRKIKIDKNCSSYTVLNKTSK